MRNGAVHQRRAPRAAVGFVRDHLVATSIDDVHYT
jgi:hypothetical protein